MQTEPFGAQFAEQPQVASAEMMGESTQHITMPQKDWDFDQD